VICYRDERTSLLQAGKANTVRLLIAKNKPEREVVVHSCQVVKLAILLVSVLCFVPAVVINMSVLSAIASIDNLHTIS